MGKSKKEPVSQRKKSNLYFPVCIREGEILFDVGEKPWRVGKSVGAGGFGKIYLASDETSKIVSQDAQYTAKIEPHKSGPLFVEMNFYIRVAKKEMIDEWKKDRRLKHLGMPYYITFGSHFYQNEKYRFLILKRYGQDLGKLFIKCKKKFHIKTVLTLGIQILDVLEYIHSHGYIHADIKDSNLLLGTGKDENNVYLMDYGLACRYVDSLGSHKDYNPDQRKAHDGTLQYTSRDAHVGAHSRRSDLEVLAYNMIHWLCGFLPWEYEMSNPEKVALKKQIYMNNIPYFLKKCFGDSPPAVLNYFLNYVVSLSFETKPDYDYCKTLLKQGIRQAGYADDGKLNINSTPTKLKNKKRIRNFDVENLVELKPLKIPRNTPRQPCVPVQSNCNRITRQKTAANNTLALRSRETFDWVKVLQSNPEKILKAHNQSNDQLKKKISKLDKEKTKCVISEVKHKKEKVNPRENPTPAITEVLKLRNSSSVFNVGKKLRSENNFHSPIYYYKGTLTPAMEEVIRRRELNSKKNCYSSESSLTTTKRVNRFKNRLQSNYEKFSEVNQPIAEVVKLKRVTRKTSMPETKTPDFTDLRKKTRKYSLEEKNVKTDSSLELTRRRNVHSPIKTTRKLRRCKKGIPTLFKSPNKKTLGTSNKKIGRREVSPSEIDFVPKLRSGFDNSEDFLIVQNLLSGSNANPKIRNYAANSGSSNTRRKCEMDYSGISHDSTFAL